MSSVRPYVTIGSHHSGPHVNALMALAERCGAIVVVIDTGLTGKPRPAPPRRARGRVAYAGMDRHENAHIHHGWRGGEA